jgi:ribosome maturation factor RimP
LDSSKRIESIIAPSLDEMGFDVVRVRLMGVQRRTLQVMVERRDGANLTVDDCATVSRAISALLDVEDPIEGAFTLEVSSPGLDRPLTRPADYDRFAGLEAKVELNRLVDGRRRFRGRIIGLFDGAVRIDSESRIAEFPFEDIERAKLVLTDELLALAGADKLRN